MVAAKRVFEGRLKLSSLSRLREVLCDEGGMLEEGIVRFVVEFDRDALQVPFVEVRVDAELPLECQRSLQVFLHPVHVVQRLGLILDEADEAGLPPDYEPLLVPADGMLRPAELVEDELILAVPVVPVKPGTELPEQEWPESGSDEVQANPFAALAELKKKN
jgi:uncharacterized protein